MQLRNDIKERLLSACENIYLGYSALDISKKPLFIQGDEVKSFESIISAAIANPETTNAIQQNQVASINVVINNHTYHLSISKSGDKYKVIFRDVNEENAISNKIIDLTRREFTFVLDNHSNEYVSACEITLPDNQTMLIGGPGKIGLYPEHLDTLQRIREHIQHDGDISSMLIALATGSGKTFVQALWILVLHSAGVNGVFGVPNQLVDQFKDDLRRILPDQMVDCIKIIKENQSNDEAEAVLQALGTAQQPAIVLGSYEELLDKHYHTLNALPAGQVMLSFDEQHLVVGQEKRKIQLTELVKKQLCMFLTATPDQKTYELCGNKAVAYMSSKQKADLKHGAFPQLRSTKAINLDDRQAQESEATLSLFDKILLGFANAFSEQQSSPILSLLEKFQYETKEYFFDNQKLNNDSSYHNLRWSYQPPTSRKMLFIIDDNEELINLNNAIHKTDEWGDQKQFEIRFGEEAEANEVTSNKVFIYKKNNLWEAKLVFSYAADTIIDSASITYGLREVLNRYQIHRNKSDERIILNSLRNMLYLDQTRIHAQSPTLPVYKNGNLHTREKIYDFFLQTENDVDKKIANNFQRYKKSKNIGIDQIDDNKVSLAEQLDRNVFTGIVDYMFSDLMGLSVIEMNEKRKNHFNDFYDAIDMELHSHKKSDLETEAYYYEKLKYNPHTTKGINEDGARKVAKIITQLIKSYKKLKLPDHEVKMHFIENWTVLNKARDNMLSTNAALFESFTEYTNKYRAMYVMTGKDKNETPIINDKPFLGFSEKPVKQKNENGTLSEGAKIRKRGILETLDNKSVEYHYLPQYGEDLTETMADNYFKLGLTGAYVSNKKTEGFSDLNLQTVISSIPHEVDSNNKPAKRIQGLGRARGKDETQTPLWFDTTAREMTPKFDLNLLNQEGDYYPNYFASVKDFNKDSIKHIGEEIGKHIIDYLCNHKNEYDEINHREANDAIQMIILNAFRGIYNSNDHDLELSKEYLTKSLRYANSYLIKEQQRLQQPYQLDKLTALAGSFIGLNYDLAYYLKTKDKRSEFNKLISNEEKNVTLDLYKKIINKSDFKLLNEKNSTFSECTGLFLRKAKHMEGDIKKEIIKSMTKEDVKSFNNTIINNILPLLVKYIDPEKQDICLTHGAEYNNWHLFFTVNHDIMSKFSNADPESRAKMAIQVFKSIPQLHHFLSEENDKFAEFHDIASNLPEKIRRTVSESSSNDINQVMNDNDNKELIPALAKYFNPEVQKTIEDTLRGFNKWGEVINKIGPDLKQASSQTDLSPLEKLKNGQPMCLAFLKATNCFQDDFLQNNIRDYSSEFENAANLISNNIQKHIKQDIFNRGKQQAKKLVGVFGSLFGKKKAQKPQENLLPNEQGNSLASYLSGDFLSQIEPLFIQQDLAVLQGLFRNKEIASAFANTLITKMASKKQQDEENNPAAFLDLMKDFFKTYNKGSYSEIVKPITFAPELMSNTMNKVMNSVKEVQIDHLANYIADEGINDFKHVLLHPDWKKLKKIIQTDISVNARNLAEAIIDIPDDLNKSTLSEAIKTVFSSYDLYQDMNLSEDKKILFADDFSEQILPDRMTALFDSIKSKYDSIEKRQKNKIILNQFYSVIRDPDIKKVIIDIMGHFNLEQIKELVKIISNENDQFAIRLFEFVELYKEGRYDKIFNEYFIQEAVGFADSKILALGNDNNDVALETSNIPFFKMFDFISKMQSEQIQCHKYFN